MIWLWRDTGDADRMAQYAQGTFWYGLPSQPMFLLIPALLKRGFAFWTALAAGWVLTIVLYMCRFPLRIDPVFPSRIDPGEGMSRSAGLGSSW
jgi:hypothetical protein